MTLQLNLPTNPYQDPLGPSFIGPWRNKIWKINSLWAEPCQPEPWIWVLAVVASAPSIVVSLTKPDTIEETYNRAQSPHKRKRKKRIPINSVIGQTGGGSGVNVPFGFKFAGDLAQRAGFYFLIADGLLDLAINSTSLAYRWGGCPGYSPSYAVLNPDFNYGPGNSFVLLDIVEDPGHIFTAASWTLPNNDQRPYTVSITMRPPTPPLTPATSFTAAVVNLTQGRVEGLPTPETSWGTGEQGTAALRKNYKALTGTSAYQLQVNLVGGWAKVEGRVYVYPSGQDPMGGLFADP